MNTTVFPFNTPIYAQVQNIKGETVRQVQSDWECEDVDSLAYIANKPVVITSINGKDVTQKSFTLEANDILSDDTIKVIETLQDSVTDNEISDIFNEVTE